MKKNAEFARISKILSEKQSITVCLPKNPTLDSVAAATALYLALLQMGKTASLASSGSIDKQFELAAQDKVQSGLVSDGDTLVVSFPYEEGNIDKVTYNIDGDRFNLLIQPRDGHERLNPDKVKYIYTGGKPDAIVTVYAPTLNSLGEIYTANKDQFNGVEIINIDRHFTNNNFGSINYVDKKSASMSEMMLGLLRSMNAKIDKEIATNLYSGIVNATNNFSAHSVGAQTFEASAFLLNHGAVKKPSRQKQRQPVDFNQSMQMPKRQVAQQQVQQPQQPEQVQQQAQPQHQQVVQPVQQVQQQPIQNQANPAISEQENTDKEGTAENKEVMIEGSATPKEWLKPKIFKGSKLI